MAIDQLVDDFRHQRQSDCHYVEDYYENDSIRNYTIISC